MTKSRHKSSSSAPIAVIVIIVLAVLLLAYPLSIGPAFWLVTHDYLSGDILTSPFYGPLTWAINNIPICGDTIDAYLWLWSGFGSINL